MKQSLKMRLKNKPNLILRRQFLTPEVLKEKSNADSAKATLNKGISFSTNFPMDVTRESIIKTEPDQIHLRAGKRPMGMTISNMRETMTIFYSDGGLEIFLLTLKFRDSSNFSYKGAEGLIN